MQAMGKTYIKTTLLILIIASQVMGQIDKGLPEEDANFSYVSINAFNIKHTLSAGYWNSKHHRGINSTLTYYRDIEVESWFGSDPDLIKIGEGPTFLSVATSFRYKPETDKGAFSGIGLSLNQLQHGDQPEYDNDLSWSRFYGRPRSKFVQYENPYSTLLIEGGYTGSSKGLPLAVTIIVAWHPVVFEMWQQEETWSAKGYITPYNFQIRLEFGLKIMSRFNKDSEHINRSWSKGG